MLGGAVAHLAGLQVGQEPLLDEVVHAELHHHGEGGLADVDVGVGGEQVEELLGPIGGRLGEGPHGGAAQVGGAGAEGILHESDVLLGAVHQQEPHGVDAPGVPAGGRELVAGEVEDPWGHLTQTPGLAQETLKDRLGDHAGPVLARREQRVDRLGLVDPGHGPDGLGRHGGRSLGDQAQQGLVGQRVVEVGEGLDGAVAGVGAAVAGLLCQQGHGAGVAQLTERDDGLGGGRAPAHHVLHEDVVHCGVVVLRQGEEGGGPHRGARTGEHQVQGLGGPGDVVGEGGEPAGEGAGSVGVAPQQGLGEGVDREGGGHTRQRGAGRPAVLGVLEVPGELLRRPGPAAHAEGVQHLAAGDLPLVEHGDELVDGVLRAQAAEGLEAGVAEHGLPAAGEGEDEVEVIGLADPAEEAHGVPQGDVAVGGVEDLQGLGPQAVGLGGGPGGVEGFSPRGVGGGGADRTGLHGLRRRRAEAPAHEGCRTHAEQGDDPRDPSARHAASLSSLAVGQRSAHFSSYASRWLSTYRSGSWAAPCRRGPRCRPCRWSPLLRTRRRRSTPARARWPRPRTRCSRASCSA